MKEYLTNTHKVCADLGGPLQIVHGKSPRSHVCSGKGSNGPTYKIVIE